MRNQALHDKYAKGRHWDLHPHSYAQRFSYFLRAENFRGLLVDAGCGHGRDVVVFKKFGFNVLGIDWDGNEVRGAKTRHPRCDFRLMDVERMKFAAESVSAVFMINVIHYVNATKALAEINRVLVPGGFLFIHFNLKIEDQHGTTDYAMTEEEARRLLKNFIEVQSRTFARVDAVPIRHEHKVLEIILKKPA